MTEWNKVKRLIFKNLPKEDGYYWIVRKLTGNDKESQKSLFYKGNFYSMCQSDNEEIITDYVICWIKEPKLPDYVV